jgi:cell division transport system permease protein
MTAPVRGGRILRSSPWAHLVSAVLLSAIAVAGLLAVMLDLAAGRAAEGVAGRLTGDETVVVWAHGLESADAAAARASDALAGVPGVREARWLDPDPGDRLVAAALGAPNGADVRLISVTAPGGGSALAASMAQALAAQGLPAKAGARSLKAGAPSADAALAAAILVPLLAILAFAAVCWLETRHEMNRGRAIIELMRNSGAHDRFIAREVRQRISGLALVAALWGASGAMVAAALAARRGLAGAIGGFDRLDLVTPWPILIIVLWAAGLAAAVMAARGRLKKLA